LARHHFSAQVLRLGNGRHPEFAKWVKAWLYAWDHIFLNLNRFYMPVLMVAPMVVIMLLAMRHMFENKRLNIAIHAASIALFVVAFAAIQNQWAVGDKQLSRSMIPHHSIAIKTCEKAQLDDPETVKLCDEIIKAQREEIAQMRDILDRLDK